MKTRMTKNDDFYRFLMKAEGFNIGFYDTIIFRRQWIEKFLKGDPRFWYSGISITCNGVKKMLCFIWEKYPSKEEAQRFMIESISKFSVEEVDEISKSSLKETLKRLRGTNIDLN